MYNCSSSLLNEVRQVHLNQMNIQVWSFILDHLLAPCTPQMLTVVLFVHFGSRSTTSMAGGSASSMATWVLSLRTSCTLPTSSELQQVPRYMLIINIMGHYCGLIHRNGPPGTHADCRWGIFSRWPAIYGICWLEEILHKAIWMVQWWG